MSSNPYIDKVIDYLRINPPILEGFHLIPAISISCYDRSYDNIILFLNERFGKLNYEELFSANVENNISFWKCDEKVRLDHIPMKKYLIEGKNMDIMGGYYLNPITQEAIDNISCNLIPIFTQVNNKIKWGWNFIYNPKSYFVYPDYMMEDKFLLYPPQVSIKNTKQLKRIREPHFIREEDHIISGSIIIIEQLRKYCSINRIKYDSIYARISGSFCIYGFKVIDQNDIDYAIKLSELEGHLSWIFASKESSDEFEGRSAAITIKKTHDDVLIIDSRTSLHSLFWSWVGYYLYNTN
jgi:hypothetical protein